jgi:hypothetical protein
MKNLKAIFLINQNMYKKTLKALFLCSILAVSVITLTACTSEGEADSSPQGFVRQYEKPEEAPDVMGIVKSMIGNEITITQYDLSKMPTPPTEEEKNSIIASGEISTGMRPGGGMGGGTGGGDPSSLFDSMESLGDVKVTIPVGIQMIKMGSRAGNDDTANTENNNATLEDINTGDMLTIWLNEDIANRKVAEFAMVRNM